MARDGSGNYSLPEAAFVAGTTIESAKVNNDLSDIAAALTQSLSKDGQTTPTANLPMGGFKLTGLGLATSSTDAARLGQVSEVRKSLIYGWTYQNNGSDATNDIDIAAGGGTDSTGASWIEGAALTKRLDAAWAAGTNQGGLDTGSIANADYYIWAIGGSAVTTDYLFSTASAIGSVTLPTGYTYGRLIGWFKRSAGAIVAFKTYETAGGGLEFKWSSPTFDVDLANTLTTSRRTDALSVPLAFSTEAIIRWFGLDNSASFLATICCPDETDAAPATNAAPGLNYRTVATDFAPRDMFVRTSSTGTVAARASIATVDTYRVWTLGFKWSRR